MRQTTADDSRAASLLLNRLHRYMHRQAVARVAAHHRGVLLAAVFIGHAVTGDARLRVIHGTATLHFALPVLVLRILRALVPVFKPVASDGAQHRAKCRGRVFAASPPGLVPKDATGQATDNGAAVLTVLRFISTAAGFIDPLTAALIARHIDAFVLRLGASNTRVVGEALRLGAEQGSRKQTGNDKTFHEKLLGLVWSAVCLRLHERKLNRFKKVAICPCHLHLASRRHAGRYRGDYAFKNSALPPSQRSTCFSASAGC